MACPCGLVSFLNEDGTAPVPVSRVIKYTDRSKRTVAWDMELGAPLADVSELLHPFSGAEDGVPEGVVACGDSAIFFTTDGRHRDTPHCSLWISKAAVGV